MKEKLRAFIVEDELHNRELLEAMLIEYCKNEVDVVGYSGSILDALQKLQVIKADVLFVDIELDDGSVFELLHNVEYKNFKIIFVTGYAEHAIRAIKFRAMDYLLKPLSAIELKEAVSKVYEIKRDESNLAENLSGNHTLHLSDYLLVHGLSSIEKISYEHISYLQADGIYTIIHHEGKKTISSKNIGSYELILPDRIFNRCHKSFIVNKYHIQKIIKGRGLKIITMNKIQLPVAIRKKEEFLLWYQGMHDHSV